MIGQDMIYDSFNNDENIDNDMACEKV